MALQSESTIRLLATAADCDVETDFEKKPFLLFVLKRRLRRRLWPENSKSEVR